MKSLALVLAGVLPVMTACRTETKTIEGAVVNLAQFEVIDADTKPSDVDNELLFTLKMTAGNPIKKSAVTIFIKKDNGVFTSIEQKINDSNGNELLDIGETVELRDVVGYNSIPAEYSNKETAVEVLEQREGQPYLQLWTGFWTP